MSHIGYVVVARRSNYPDAVVSSIHDGAASCENHAVYCEGMAERGGDADVKYVVASISLPDPDLT